MRLLKCVILGRCPDDAGVNSASMTKKLTKSSGLESRVDQAKKDTKLRTPRSPMSITMSVTTARQLGDVSWATVLRESLGFVKQ